MSAASASTASEPIVLRDEDRLEMLECARFGDLDDLRELLALGCDANFCDAGGSTALHKAAANGQLEALAVLADAGARFAPNASGNSPLHFACLTGQRAAAEWLLARYARECDVFAKNAAGRSAFTEAAAGGHEELARLLLLHPSAEPARAGGAGGAAGAGAGAGAGAESGEGAGAGGEADGDFRDDDEDVADDGEDADLVDEAAAAAAAEEAGEGGGAVAGGAR